MNIDTLLKEPPQWCNGLGPYAEIVLSSRVRLARNLSDFLFTNRIDKQTSTEIKELLKQTQAESKEIKEMFFIDMETLADIDKVVLMERHLISKALIDNSIDKAAIINKDETVSIMANEEDHLRLQSFEPGLNLHKAYETIDKIDTQIEKKLNYAFSSEFGYLTACPTNTGTGIRISVLIHLPGLVHSGEIRNVLETVSKIGLSIRGFYGEGTQIEGNFFQISNQATLGKSEQEIIDTLNKAVLQIIELERNSREILIENAKNQTEDKIWRAYGILKYATLVSSKEFINLSSAVRLGVGLGIVRSCSIKNLNRLLILTKPAHLQKMAGRLMSPDERDIERAIYVRKTLE